MSKLRLFIFGAPGKYLVAGLTAFTAEYLSFFLMYRSGVALIAANSLSFLVGLTTSFLVNRLWTFGHAEYDRKASHQFVFYAVLALVNLLISNLFIEASQRSGLAPEIGKLIVMVAIPVWNFFIFKKIIFKHADNS